MEIIGPISSRAPLIAASKGTLTLLQVTFDVFHHDDRIVHHETYREDYGQQCEEVDRKTSQHHEENRSHK